MPEGELILYTTDDGVAQIQLRAVDGTVWLTQAQMADLFQTTPQAITQLIGAIYEEAELDEAATCNEFLQVRSEREMQAEATVKEYLTVRTEGKRQVSRSLIMAKWAKKLDALLSVNECDMLTHAGRRRMHVPQKLAAEGFEAFNSDQCAAAVLAADEVDIAELGTTEKTSKKGREIG